MNWRKYINWPNLFWVIFLLVNSYVFFYLVLFRKVFTVEVSKKFIILYRNLLPKTLFALEGVMDHIYM